LSPGRFGEASREGTGEFAAEVPCLLCSFLDAGSEDVDELRDGLDVLDVSSESTGSCVSFGAPEMEVKAVLSSMIATFFFG
jgi:hypothetical protein